MKYILAFATLLLFANCSSTVKSTLVNTTYPSFDENTTVYILQENQTAPYQSELLGEIKIGDSGFSTNCGYEKMVLEAKSIARKSGANLIKITELTPPSFSSTCYRMKAKIYRNSDAEVLAQLDDKNRSTLATGVDYAVIYFYRPSNGYGSFLGYKINTEKDSIIGRMRNGEKFEFKTTKFGNQTFYGELETKKEIVINVEKGKEYYVRCGVKTGIMVGRPELTVVDNHIGKKEFAATNKD